MTWGLCGILNRFRREVERGNFVAQYFCRFFHRHEKVFPPVWESSAMLCRNFGMVWQNLRKLFAGILELRLRRWGWAGRIYSETVRKEEALSRMSFRGLLRWTSRRCGLYDTARQCALPAKAQAPTLVFL